jgi:hypothetical protein
MEGNSPPTFGGTPPGNLIKKAGLEALSGLQGNSPQFYIDY